MSEQVNHPQHYNSGGLECIDGKEEVASFCKLNAFKYIWRSNHKGKCAEDMEKAEWYIRKYNELLSNE